jgi:hypothetical protein
MKRGRKEGRRKRMLGNKIFRIKRRKTNRVRDKYENNMETTCCFLFLQHISSTLPYHYNLPLSPPPPIPPLSHNTHHALFHYINK